MNDVPSARHLKRSAEWQQKLECAAATGIGMELETAVVSVGDGRGHGLLRSLVQHDGVELRLHGTVLYNSMYRSDDQLLVDQHAYGLPAAQSPVYHYRQTDESEMFDSYVSSFEAISVRGQRGMA